ncbi:MAG TPA: hypothetical protein PLC98_03920 [Anaerolineales bacterium]|nr:hypothetical protein [Anaerolineales bacterium]
MARNLAYTVSAVAGGGWRLAQHLFAAGAFGYCLMFVSEQLFWARLRPDDALGSWLLGWVVYSLAGYLAHAALVWSRARSFATVFLVGALFGWLIEGVFVQTAFEDLPLSISWTGLAWHALLSFGVGWWAIGGALRRSGRSTLIWATAIGLAYGLWAISWWLEPDGGVATPEAFAGYTTIAALIWILAQFVYHRLAPALACPNPALMAIAIGVGFLWFALVGVPAAPISAPLLPMLLALTLLGLWGSRRRGDPLAIVAATSAIPLSRFLALLALPATASLVYLIAYVLQLRLQVNWLFYLATTGAGFGLYVWAVLRNWGWRAGSVSTTASVKENRA